MVNRYPVAELLRVQKDSIEKVMVVDSLALVFPKRLQKGAPMLRVYEIASFSKRAEFIPYGSGKGELLQAFTTKGNGKMLLYDAVKKEIAVMDLNSMENDPSFSPSFYHTNILSQEIIPYHDRLLFLNRYSYQGQAPRIRISDKKWNYYERSHYKCDAINVVDGSLHYNKKMDRIAFLADYEPVIELMDKQGKLLKKIRFPHSVIEFVRVPHPDLKMEELLYPYQDDPHFPEYCFCCADSNDDYIVGAFWQDDWRFAVMILDWDGNLVDGFLTESRVVNISFSSDSKLVYCWEENGNDRILNVYESRL